MTNTGNQSVTPIIPSLADKKSVFDSDVRSEAVESLEWAPEPDPEEESTSSLRLEAMTKEEDETGLGAMTRTITTMTAGDEDAVIVFEDDTGDQIAGATPMDRGKLQDVATYSSSDGERDVV